MEVRIKKTVAWKSGYWEIKLCIKNVILVPTIVSQLNLYIAVTKQIPENFINLNK